MIGDKYLIQIGQESYKAITTGIYLRVAKTLLNTEAESFALPLAAAVSLRIVGDTPSEPKHITFRKENLKRIEDELQKPYIRTPQVCEILSRAAYNIGYGRYVAAGGGRIMNHYLGYIRSDRRPNKLGTDLAAHLSIAAALSRLSGAILHPIEALQHFNMWIPRSNDPNEQEYYQSICAFAQHRAQ